MFTIDAMASLTTGESLLFAPTLVDVHKFLLHAYPWSISYVVSYYPLMQKHSRPYILQVKQSSHFLIGEEVEAGNYSDSSDSASNTDSDTASSTDSDTAEDMYAINTSRIHTYIQIAVRNAFLMVYKNMVIILLLLQLLYFSPGVVIFCALPL